LVKKIEGILGVKVQDQQKNNSKNQNQIFEKLFFKKNYLYGRKENFKNIS
jgi:hypothetical protein